MFLEEVASDSPVEARQRGAQEFRSKVCLFLIVLFVDSRSPREFHKVLGFTRFKLKSF